jgi:hypothetical protein
MATKKQLNAELKKNDEENYDYKIIKNSIDYACHKKSTDINKEKSIIDESIYNIDKTPNEKYKLFLDRIYDLVYNYSGITHYHQDIKQLDVLKDTIDHCLKNHKNISIDSNFFKNKNTIIELEDHYVQTLTKGDSYGKNAIWKYDKPGLQFLKKTNYNLHDFATGLNTPDRDDFYAVYNNKIISGTGSSYFIDDIIHNTHPKELTGMSLYDGDKISCNDYFNLVNHLDNLAKENYNWNNKKYIAFNNSPYTEYAVDLSNGRFNVTSTLFNGYGKIKQKNNEYSKEYHYDDFIKMGYEILNPLDLYKKYESYQNRLTNKWKEISETNFINASKYAFPNSNISDGFFTKYPDYGNLHDYYIKYKDRYFTSLQRKSYSNDYIKANLESEISRLEPLSNVIEKNNEYLKEHFPELMKNGKIGRLSVYAYEILKSAGFTVSDMSKNILIDSDGKKHYDEKYSYDINNQISDKHIKNQYDEFAIKYLDDASTSRAATPYTIKKELEFMGFKGDTASLADNLFKNKNIKYNNYETLENIINKNICDYKLTPPTIQNISSMATSSCLVIDQYIKSYNNQKFANKNEIDLDKINTSRAEKKYMEL